MIALRAETARAQKADSTRVGSTRVDSVKVDSTNKVTFPALHVPPASLPFGRTIDVALTGGIGYYALGTSASLQPTANADFFARNQSLDFTAGFHWGFSDPSTKAIAVGFRFPIRESEDLSSGVYGDAELLLVDNGADSNSFSTGIRLALAGRSAPMEYRFSTELRRIPFGSERFEAWAGIELGFFIDLLREDAAAPTPKDSLRAALRYIATSQELEDLDRTESEHDIEVWLNRFWAKRNITGSPMNEARQEYMRRIELANERYGTPRRMGVATDMGRVLLLYGQPDRIEAANSTSMGSQRRYTLWVDQDRVKGYRTAIFLFVHSQISATGTFEGHGEFREIYSNVAGEPTEGVPTDLPEDMLAFIQGFQ